MNILGIDPSPDGKHTFTVSVPRVLKSESFLPATCSCEQLPILVDGIEYVPQVIILEKPVPQGERTRLKSYTPLCIEYGKLVGELKRLYPKARIFEVPANVIRQQTGWTTAHGRADPFIKRYLELLGYECGRGKLFNSTHKRDALMCALFAWNDKRNAMYETTEVKS